MHRVVTMSLNSRWRLAHLGMCAPALFAHGQQMNIGSSFPSYLKRLRVSCSTVVAQPPTKIGGTSMGNTLRSILIRLVAYVAVAIAAGLLFLAVATVYELMWPRPVVPLSQMSNSP